MAFRFTPQVVSSGKAQVFDFSALAQAMREKNLRKHQEMREDKQRAEAEYNYDQEALTELIGKAQGEDNEYIDEKIVDAQKWLTEVNAKGERVNTPQNKAEFRRRINEINSLVSRSKSSYQEYTNYMNLIENDPNINDDAKNKLIAEYKKGLGERSIANFKKIYMDSYDGYKWLDSEFTADKNETELTSGLRYNYYGNIQEVGEDGKIKLRIEEGNMKRWTTGEMSDRKAIWFEREFQKKKADLALEEQEIIKQGGEAFKEGSKEYRILNDQVTDVEKREFVVNKRLQTFKGNYDTDRQNLQKKTKDEIEKDNVNRSIANMAKHVVQGGDMNEVLQSFSGTSKEEIKNVPVSDIEKMKKEAVEVQNQLTKDKESKAKLEEELASGDLNKEEKISKQAEIAKLNTKISGAEDNLEVLSSISNYNYPKGNTHILIVYDQGYVYDEATGRMVSSVVTGAQKTLKPKIFTYNANNEESVRRALLNVGSLRPNALFGIKSTEWTSAGAGGKIDIPFPK